MALRTHTRVMLPAGRHLSVNDRTVEPLYPVHWHSHFEIEIILGGEGVCRINDVSYPIPEYRLFFLSPTDFHALDTRGDMRLINVSFDEEMLDGQDVAALLSPGLGRAYPLGEGEHERLVSAARLLEHEERTGGDSCRALLSYLVKTLLRGQVGANQAAPEAQERLAGIRRAYLYLEMHFKEPITLATLAAEAGYHPTYFSEVFHRATGESYLETLTRLRLGYARSLLAGGFSVSDACHLSGFGSLSAFGNAFRRHMGISAAAYRKSCGK